MPLVAVPEECIRRSDGGVSEPFPSAATLNVRVYQAFRRWGIGTGLAFGLEFKQSVSGVPTVGYRNSRRGSRAIRRECIRRSDGGVSEPALAGPRGRPGVYQAFRRWGIGTGDCSWPTRPKSVSGVPTVGYRNGGIFEVQLVVECIRRSDGGVSELPGVAGQAFEGVYQAFRRWGIGTFPRAGPGCEWSVSGVPTVGYRNEKAVDPNLREECIRRSDGGVSEHVGGDGNLLRRVYQAFRRWGVGVRDGAYQRTVESYAYPEPNA